MLRNGALTYVAGAQVANAGASVTQRAVIAARGPVIRQDRPPKRADAIDLSQSRINAQDSTAVLDIVSTAPSY